MKKEAKKQEKKNVQKDRKTKKYLNKILQGELPEPSLATRQKISDDLGLDLQEKE